MLCDLVTIINGNEFQHVFPIHFCHSIQIICFLKLVIFNLTHKINSLIVFIMSLLNTFHHK